MREELREVVIGGGSGIVGMRQDERVVTREHEEKPRNNVKLRGHWSAA